jgi:hypothetical protein
MSANNTAINTIIFDVLLSNGMLTASDTFESFEFKVIRAKWTPEDESIKFLHLTDAENNVLPESEEERERVSQHLLEKECYQPQVPRLVLVNYTEDRSAKLSPGNNMYPPLKGFSQKGMVINLETKEVLCPGTSWMNTITDISDLKVLAADSMMGVRVQRPIEGATVTMFYYPEGDEIFLGTNRRVLKLSKIICGGGSRWNFYGSGAVNAQMEGLFPIVSEDQLKFDIHRGALTVLLEIALDYLGISDFSCSTDEQIVSFVSTILKTVFFPSGNENVVYSGILSGRPFANQSKVMDLEDYENLSFTLSSVSRRVKAEDFRTTWEEIAYNTIEGITYRSEVGGSLFDIFRGRSLDVSKFEVDPESIKRSNADNVWEAPEMNDSEDILVIYDMAENGQRRIVRYQSPESRFRDFVIRGGSDQELEEVASFFPRHRNRKNPTPANIRERVQQVITLSIRGTGYYAFHHVPVLGTEGAIQLSNLVSKRMYELMDARLVDASRHWEDVAYPLSQFTLRPDQEPASHKFYRSDKNKRVCNGLAVLYACVSEGLKEVVVDEIARYFISRMLIAMAAFLPARSLDMMEQSFLRAIQFEGENVPIGIHKVRIVCPNPTLNNSQRKYRVAESVSNLSFLDVSFAMGFVNFPYQSSTHYTVPLVSY